MSRKRDRACGKEHWENYFFDGYAPTKSELLDFIKHCLSEGIFLYRGVPDLTFITGRPYDEVCVWLSQFVGERHIRLEVAEILRGGVSIRNGRRRRAIPYDQRVAIMAKTSGHCVYCGVVLTLDPGQPNSLHADHVFGAINGGCDDPANLMPSCSCCNLSKKDKTASAFLRGKVVLQ